MSRTKTAEFHEQLKLERSKLEEWHRKVTTESKKNSKQIKVDHNLKYRLHSYNFKNFFVNIINDSRIDYQLNTFIRKYGDIERNLNMLRFLSISPYFLINV